MAAEQKVDLSYRGIPVGRGLVLRDVVSSTAFIEVAHPMPVGTAVEVINEAGQEFVARVVSITEQTQTAPCAGLTIAVADLPKAVSTWWDSLATLAAARNGKARAVEQRLAADGRGVLY